VAKGGRISENFRHLQDHVWVSFFVANCAHSKSRSYNLKNCNFFFGASLVPGFGIFQ